MPSLPETAAPGARGIAIANRLRRHGLALAVALAGVLFLALGTLISTALPPLSLVLRWCSVACFLGFLAIARSLTAAIFTSMVVGYACGVDLPTFAIHLNPLSQIFIRLVRTIIAPLLFSTLVLGIAGHGGFRRVARLGIKAIIYFELVSAAALFLGLGAIHLTRAGEAIKRSAHESLALPARPSMQEGSGLADIFPENVAEPVADNNVLQIVILSIIFAGAVATLEDKKRQPILRICRLLSEVMFRYTRIVMLFAPLGVGGAIAYATAVMGTGIFGNLALLLVTLYGALATFVLVVLLPIALLARVPVRRFARACAEPAMIAFATSASEAALPRAMQAMEELGVPEKIVSFVIPLGYSFNLDGSTLYLSLAALFVAQAAGISMTFGQQLFMVATLMLASKGVAGVPRATFVVLLGTLGSFHLPEWPLVMILSIDALMDMGRTALNVTGNCLASVVLAIWEGEFRLRTQPELTVPQAGSGSAD